MGHAPLVLAALTVVWLAGRWNRCLAPALSAVGLHRPVGYRRRAALPPAGAQRPTVHRHHSTQLVPGETVCVRVEVGYGVSLGVLRERVGVAVAEHRAWDGRGWGMQVVDATRGAVVVRVHATAGSRGGARQLEADLRELVGRDYPESPLGASVGDQGFAVPNQALER